jgi:P-type conjugative transfer protein TrbJ
MLKQIAHKSVAVVTLFSLLCLGVPAPAHASAFVGATEITQLANFGQLSASYGQQIQAFITQTAQLQAAVQQLQRLSSMNWTSVSGVLSNLQSVVQNANALSYAMANMDSQFTARFPLYGTQPTGSFASRYATWSKTTNGTIQASLDMAHLQNANLSTEAGLIQTLQQQAQTTQGTVDTLSVGNQIAGEELNQLMELRQLMMADMSSKAAFQASQQAQEDEAQRQSGFFAPVTLYNSWN